MVIALFVLSSTLVDASTIEAQEGSHPFSALQLRAGPAAEIDIGELGDRWAAEHGFHVGLSTPFYLGSATVGVQSTSFEARSIEQPDFHLRTFTLGWDGQIGLPFGVEGSGGVQVGAAAMHFLEREPTLNGDENEFLAGFQAGLSLPLHRRVRLSGTAGHRKIFTRIPLRITYLTLGLGYTLATPPFLREVLE